VTYSWFFILQLSQDGRSSKHQIHTTIFITLHNHNVTFTVNTVVLHCSIKCIGTFNTNGMAHIKPAVTTRNTCCQTSTFYPNRVSCVWHDSHNKHRLFTWMASTGWSWYCRSLYVTRYLG